MAGRDWHGVHWINLFLEGVAGAMLFVLMAMTCIDVAGRYLLNQPLDGATELTRLLMAVIVFAVLPVVSWREQHVSVDLLDNVFPKPLVGWRQGLLSLICSLAMAGLCYRIWALAWRAQEYGDVTEYLRIPLFPVILFISLLCGLTAVVLLANVLRYLRGHGPMSPTVPK